MTDAERLAAEEEAGWRELHEAFASLTPERLEEPGLTPDGWSAKVAMYHLATWMGDCADQLEAMRLGTFGGRVDTKAWIDEQNRLQFMRSRGMEVSEVRGYLERSRARMLEAWRLLPDVTTEAWEWFEESGPLHYRKHLEDLRLWSGGLHGSGPDEP